MVPAAMAIDALELTGSAMGFLSQYVYSGSKPSPASNYSEVAPIYPSMYSFTMTISQRLESAMKAAGYESQSALSRASGVPQPTINRILNGVGKKGPEAHTLVQLAAALHVTFEWLHEGIGTREHGQQRRLAHAGASKDAEALAEEGIEFGRLPWIPRGN
eukprot:gene50865-68082_t